MTSQRQKIDVLTLNEHQLRQLVIYQNQLRDNIIQAGNSLADRLAALPDLPAAAHDALYGRR